MYPFVLSSRPASENHDNLSIEIVTHLIWRQHSKQRISILSE